MIKDVRVSSHDLLMFDRHGKISGSSLRGLSFNLLLYSSLCTFPLRYLQVEIVQQSRASLLGYHFLFTHDLNV